MQTFAYSNKLMIMFEARAHNKSFLYWKTDSVREKFQEINLSGVENELKNFIIEHVEKSVRKNQRGEKKFERKFWKLTK